MVTPPSLSGALSFALVARDDRPRDEHRPTEPAAPGRRSTGPTIHHRLPELRARRLEPHRREGLEGALLGGREGTAEGFRIEAQGVHARFEHSIGTVRFGPDFEIQQGRAEVVLVGLLGANDIVCA